MELISFVHIRTRSIEITSNFSRRFRLDLEQHGQKLHFNKWVAWWRLSIGLLQALPGVIFGAGDSKHFKGSRYFHHFCTHAVVRNAKNIAFDDVSNRFMNDLWSDFFLRVNLVMIYADMKSANPSGTKQKLLKAFNFNDSELGIPAYVAVKIETTQIKLKSFLLA